MKLLAAYRPGSNRLQADLWQTYSDRGPLLLLMRHGQVDKGPGKVFLGQTNLPLDETGRSQARAWASELSRIRLAEIHTSALGRARQTAALCCPGREALVDERLNEIGLGHWDGCSFDQVQTRFPDAFLERGRDIYRFRPPEGESFQDLHDRSVPFFDSLERRMQNLAGHVLVLTHAGVIRTLCCHWSGAPVERLFDHRPGYGEIRLFSTG